MSHATPEDLTSNNLLAILADADRDRLTPHIQVFDYEAGTVLQLAGESVVHTWFPCAAALASYVVVADAGDAVEVAVVGSEGAIGGIVSNGNVPAYATAQVRNSGRFLRIRTAALEQAKIDSISLRHWFARYSDCLLAQVFQTAACNARHTIEQRACKWLLAAADRTQSDEITMTQEDLARLLGVGRSFVNRTLRNLRSSGLIETRRSRIVLKNRPGLRHASCGCTGAIENHFDEVLHGIYALG
jgi:CRP-like cAMP-binding protein